MRAPSKTAIILVEGEATQSPSQQQSLTPAQQQFNVLGEKITQQKQQVEEWQALVVSVQQRIHGKLMPLYDQLARQHGKLIEQLHQASLKYSLTAWESAQLHQLIIELCEQVLRHKLPDEDPLIAQIYQLYRAEQAQTNPLAPAASELPQQQHLQPLDPSFDLDCGVALFDADDPATDPATSFEVMAQQQEAERHYQKQQRKMARLALKQQAKEQSKEERDTAQQQANAPAQKSLRQLYQRLAAMLHPDREQDEQQKITKTDLMQQATEAYQSQDLLGLIQLQNAVSFNTNSNFAQLADEQLQLYNLNLRRYSQTLDENIAEHKARLASLCAIERVEMVTEKSVIKKLKEQVSLLTQYNAMLSQQLKNLKDAKAIKAFLRQYS
ncbi:hypothetical protein [Alkanindiges illinoisensis]|uniref:hypothetical protein n=1 Tax=Alkanindiges illinoisensis TaxID=197183 RepID=UPI0004792AD4|nr:hypothetical protein [Alkanindiges illinoisensis]